jgi:hypothetical protein
MTNKKIARTTKGRKRLTKRPGVPKSEKAKNKTERGSTRIAPDETPLPEGLVERAAERAGYSATRGPAFTAETIDQCRRAGIKDRGIAAILRLEAEEMCEAANDLLSKPDEGAPWPGEKAKKARAVLELVERSFESGSEVPGVNLKSTVLLREALRAARDDMWVITTTARHTDIDDTSRAELRAETRIDLALALHDFLREEEDEQGEATALQRTRARATGAKHAAGGAS